MKKILFLFTLIVCSTTAQNATAQKKVIHQLRIYEIFDNNKAAFHQRFEDHAQRIMKNYGFHIVAMWESQGDKKTEFVYLLEWPDIITLQDSWAKFMKDEEWKEIKRRTGKLHGQLVGEIQDRILTATPYSPVQGLDRMQVNN